MAAGDPPPPFSSVLDGLVLSRILFHIETIADLATLARCSKWLCKEVQGARDAWQRHADTLPDCPSRNEAATTATMPPKPPSSTWRPPPPCPAAVLCRQRLEHWRRAAFARGRADAVVRLYAESEVEEAERAVRALTREAAQEERTRTRLSREAATVLDALRAAEAQAAAAGGRAAGVQAWVPAAVRAGWEAAAAGGFASSSSSSSSAAASVVAARGVDARVRLRQLDQELAVSDSRAETLSMSLRAARRRLDALRRRAAEGGGGGGDAGGGGPHPTPLVLD